MKEKERIPLRDIKLGTRVLGRVFEGAYRGVKPNAKYLAEENLKNYFRKG